MRRLRDDPERRPPGSGPLNYALFELDGRPSAYALYRIAQREEDGHHAPEILSQVEPAAGRRTAVAHGASCGGIDSSSTGGSASGAAASSGTTR